MSAVTFGGIAARLVANGYRPVPISKGKKSPAIDDWPRYSFLPADATRFHDYGVGILTGFEVAPVDIDVLDEDAVAKIEAIAQRVLGKAPRRIGNFPKSALLYAIAGDVPYTATRRFRLPADLPGAKAHRVEVLRKDKQLVCFGVHPDTKRPYEWNGCGSPLDVPVGALTVITAEQVRSFITEADELLAQFGEPIAMREMREGDAWEGREPSSYKPSSLGQRAVDPERFRAALAWLPNDYGRQSWTTLGHSIKAALGEEGWPDFEAWSQKSPSYTGQDTKRVWDSFNPSRSTAGRLLREALDRGWNDPKRTERSRDARQAPPDDSIPLAAYASEPEFSAPSTELDNNIPVSAYDFWSYMPTHGYIFVPTRELWPPTSVNARCHGVVNSDGSMVTKKKAKKQRGSDEVVFEDVPISATEWLDQQRSIEQMTWAPGMPMVIENRLVTGGGWIDRFGCRTFNLYQPPRAQKGSASDAGTWIAHLQRVYPEEYEHIILWLAHRVQRPGEKINHGLVMGGSQGVGKDTILEPVKHAVGPWNICEVSPSQLMGRFNGFLRSVILRVSEARDQGDSGGNKIDRYSVYEHCKTLTAAPPDVLRVDEKNTREYSIMNVCGVIFTTNHLDGVYLPLDDRRHYVAWSESRKEDFDEAYWKDIYHWYANEGGFGHVADYLATLDLSAFNPKAPPPKTRGFFRMVEAGRSPENSELSDALDLLGWPSVITIAKLCWKASDEFSAWLKDRRNSRQIPHRLDDVGYVSVRNASAKDGQWVIDGKRQTIYAKRELSVRDQIAEASLLCDKSR